MAEKDQKKALLTYLEENLPVASNQFDGYEGYKKLMTKWNEVAETLNERGPAKKTVFSFAFLNSY